MSKSNPKLEWQSWVKQIWVIWHKNVSQVVLQHTKVPCNSKVHTIHAIEIVQESRSTTLFWRAKVISSNRMPVALAVISSLSSSNWKGNKLQFECQNTEKSGRKHCLRWSHYVTTANISQSLRKITINELFVYFRACHSRT